MEQVRNTANDQAAEIFLGYLLRAGVLVAAATVLAGGCLYLLRHGHEIPDYRSFTAEPRALRDIPEIVRGAWSLKEGNLIQLGMLVLLATPVMRVAFSVYVFFRQRDFTYVVLTLIVLTLLLYGILKA